MPGPSSLRVPLLAYNLGTVLLGPAILARKGWNAYRNRKTYEFDHDRWIPLLPETASGATPPAPSPGARTLVLCGVGFGDMGVMAALSRELETREPGLHVLWAVRSREAAAAARRAHPDRFVGLLPFDSPGPVQRWFVVWRPNALVFVEKFWHPNFIAISAQAGTALFAVEAKTRTHTGVSARWHRLLLSQFRAIGARSLEQLRRLEALDAPGVKIEDTGSLKMSVPAPPPNQVDEQLQSWLAGPGLLFVAGSTHPGDEEWILQAWQASGLAADHRLLLAPRKTERAPEVRDLVARFGWQTSLRTRPQPDSRVFILDTWGELNRAYRASAASFVGGTISGVGQSPSEAISHGVPVLFGPRKGHFAAEQETCIAGGAALRIHSPAELAGALTSIAQDPRQRDSLSSAATALAARSSQSLDHSVTLILSNWPR